LHDRVQQAAYALIAEEQRGAFHLRVGRLLLERTPEAGLDGRLFDIANHMNLGASLVVAPDERRRLAELNLRAGRKAKAGAAYQSAVAYLSAGAALLSPERWESDPALAHALHFELAESHYLSGAAEDAERLCSELLSRARTNADRADVYRLRIQIALRRVDMGRMIGQLIECLGLFGIQLSARPSTEDVTAEVRKVHDELLDCRIEDLLDRPLMQDHETMALVGVLAAAYMGLFVTDREIAGLVVCQMVRLSVKHGTCPESAIAYSAFGAALCERLMAYEEGFRFGKVAYDITERFGFEAVKAEVCHHLGNDIAFWTHPFGKSIEYCRSGLRAALETGNIIYACINWTYIVFYQLARGDPLEAAHGEVTRYRDFLLKLKLARVMPTAIILERFVLNMLDRTAHFSTFSGDGFDQDAFEGDLLNKILPAWKLYYLTFKTQARVLSEDYREAFDAATQAKGLVWTAGSQITLVTYRFSAALATAARYHELDRGEQEEARAALADHERTIRRWSETNPQNFLGMYLLVAAEISRLDGRPEEALTRYEAAANAFHASGFVHWEGLAHAIAARFFHDRSLSEMASACVREARACYERWGATGKVRQLDLRYADLLRPAQPVVPRALATSIEQLDTAAIIKATQALSSEVLSDRVLAVLMHLVIEHSGARRSCLLLSRDAQLAVAAQAETGRDGVNVRIPAPGDPVDLSCVPASVVLYTMRTGEKVIVDDASTHKTYFADEYVAREHVRSLLCIPVKRNDAVVGALYMDNNLSVGVFDARQLAVVELVTAQAAVSLENARLYEKLADENAKRQATEEKLREQLGIIDRQQQAIQQLSTPIIEVWDGVVVMPVVGIFDSTRAKAMIEPLLATVQRRGCRYAIIDLTGVDIVDTQTAEQILRVVLAVRLLGAQGIVSGIRPDVARTIVALGVDLSSIVTLARLRDALVYCIRRNEATA
jgi:GAF domain-containing protein